ncbi:reverse transcriptase [Phytophthora megakarya]|uniref:Reverse transcriptase n=1 Tax=Phytophthora megakarya TaxID=4795 RepID=A0A225VXM4_9STRA|nr:reverse transcriptase [Phytophthora megakarya]
MSVQPGTGHVTGYPLNGKCAASVSHKTDTDPFVKDQLGTSDLDLTWASDQDYDECVYYHEGSDLYAEDVDGQMAILPEMPVTTEDTPEEIDRFCQRIWKLQHLSIGEGNALPPTARGVVCDIDVDGARPIVLKCRKLRIQFREKLADLIKGLLSAKMISYSRAPWASRVVVIIKKNGVNIRLSIDYRLVNIPTQLMVYPMPLINDLLEDLESTLVLFFGYGECILGSENDGSSSLELGLFGNRLIEDYTTYASVLYELRKTDFSAMMKEATQAWIEQVLGEVDVDLGSREDQGVDHRKTLDREAPDSAEVDPRWIHAQRSLNVLKTRIATTPILPHFDPDLKATVVAYASDWAISGSLMQEYDQIYYAVMFASRT